MNFGAVKQTLCGVRWCRESGILLQRWKLSVTQALSVSTVQPTVPTDEYVARYSMWKPCLWEAMYPVR